MKKSNIIFFTWDNEIFLKKEFNRWVDIFISKYWEFNISRFNKESILSSNIEQELTSMPFLWQFRLIIFEDLPLTQDNKETVEEEIYCPKCNNKIIKIGKNFTCSYCKYKEEIKSIDSLILSCLDNIPDNNIVLFIQQNPDKRLTLYKKLLQIATIKEFSNLSWDSLKDYIRSRLLNIDSLAIKKLIEYKNSNFSKIDKEIDKLELFKSNDRITEDDIIKYIVPEIEVSIFKITDAIFELNPKIAILNFNKLLETNNIFQIFSSIVSNIRSFLYIHFLIDNKYTKNDVIKILQIHPYVFEKAISYKQNKKYIYSFFNNLLQIDLWSKIWNLIWDWENSVKLSLEKVILNLKNLKNK